MPSPPSSLLENTGLVLGVALFYPLLLCVSFLLSRLVNARPPPASRAAGDSLAPEASRSQVPLTASAALSYGTRDKDDTPCAAAAAVPVESGEPRPAAGPASGWRRACRAIPLPPPVLLMLLTGVIVRALLDSDVAWVRRLFSYRTTSTAGVGDTAASRTGAQRQAHFLSWLLWLTRPLMLLALATIAQNIGSHLSYAQLSRLRRPLTIFLCLFFAIVYVGMLFVFTGAAGPLLGLRRRQVALEKGVHALVSSSVAAGAGKGSSASATAVRHAANALLAYHQVYLRRTAWTFALVAATVTLERSSPEFLSAMQNTGVTSGLVPVFTLCIAACQDVFALFAFIVCSAMASSRQTEGTLTLSERVNELRLAVRRVSAATADGADGTDPPGLITRADLAAVIANRRSTGLQLVLIGNATLGALLTALLVRRLCFFLVDGAQRPATWLRRRFSSPAPPGCDDTTEDGRAPPSGSPLLFSGTADDDARDSSAAVGTGTRLTYMLLTTIGLTLVLWEVATPCELLLAAVFTGAAINFYTPCPYFAAGMKATQTLANVVLFTTMGLRTSFDARPPLETEASLSDGGEGETADPPLSQHWQTAIRGPSASAVVCWGLLFFVARVFVYWLGGLVGGYGARRFSPSKQAARQRESGASVGAGADFASTAAAHEVDATTASSSADPNLAAEESVARASGVHWYIGFALLTQLAIALTLNQRGSEEYDSRLRDLLPPPGLVQVGERANGFFFSLEEVILPMQPLAQSYMVAIVCAMLVGPVLGMWYLRKVGNFTKSASAHAD